MTTAIDGRPSTQRHDPADWYPLPGGYWRSPSGAVYRGDCQIVRKVIAKRAHFGLATEWSDSLGPPPPVKKARHDSRWAALRAASAGIATRRIDGPAMAVVEQASHIRTLYANGAARALRLHAGLSAVDFAAALGVTPGAVCSWEQGRTTLSTVNALAAGTLLDKIRDFVATAPIEGRDRGAPVRRPPSR